MKTLRKLVRFCSQTAVLVSCVAIISIYILTAPSTAYADTAIASATQEVMNILVPLFVSIVGALAAWILSKVRQKLNLDIGEKASAAWDDLARKAALRGAEWARKKSKDLTEGKKLPGGEVMEVAATWAIEMAKQQGLPELARAKLEGLIESRLFEIRAAGGLDTDSHDALPASPE